MRTITLTLLLLFTSCTLSATQEKKLTKIRLTAPGGYLDETTIYFDLGVTPAYDPPEDGPKAYNNIANAPSIFSITTDNVFCSTNGYSPLDVSEVVPLGIRTDTAGIHIFTAPVITNFDTTIIIQLEDRQENIFTNLRNNFYAVQLADSQYLNNRFFLHVSRPIQFTPVTAGCANNDGSLQVNGDNTITWTSAYLFDSTLSLVKSFSNISGSYSFDNLPEGDYKIQLVYQDYSAAKLFRVNGNYIVAHIIPTTLGALVQQEITFHSIAYNTTIYEWDFGDGARITGVANPDYTYYSPGNYTVVLKCSNEAGCEYRDSVAVSITDVTGVTNITNKPRLIWASSNTINIVLNEEIKQGAELKIYNLLGQPVYQNPVTELTTVITLNQEPTGYYIVSLKNNNVESTKRLFIGNK